MHISTKCLEDGGLWAVSAVVHGEEEENLEDLDDQTYEGPDGIKRRIGLQSKVGNTRSF